MKLIFSSFRLLVCLLSLIILVEYSFASQEQDDSLSMEGRRHPHAIKEVAAPAEKITGYSSSQLSLGRFEIFPVEISYHILSFCDERGLYTLLQTSCEIRSLVIKSKYFPPHKDEDLIRLIEQGRQKALKAIAISVPETVPKLLTLYQKYTDYENYDSPESWKTSIETWNKLCTILRVGSMLGSEALSLVYKTELESIGSTLMTGHAEVEDRLGTDTEAYYEAVKKKRTFYLVLLSFEDKIAKDFMLTNNSQRKFLAIDPTIGSLLSHPKDRLDESVFIKLNLSATSYPFIERDSQKTFFL